jgi:hypothetical protein
MPQAMDRPSPAWNATGGQPQVASDKRLSDLIASHRRLSLLIASHKRQGFQF